MGDRDSLINGDDRHFRPGEPNPIWAAITGLSWTTALYGLLLIAALGLAIAGLVIALSINNNYYPNKCSDMTINGLSETQQREIFVFSNSLDDFGNWLHDIPPLGYYSLDVDRIVQPGTSEYTVFPAGPGKFGVNHVSSTGRWGGEHNAMDFVAQFFKIKSYKSSDITSYNHNLVGQNGFLVNFGIGGATANGNVYNAPTVALPHNFDQVVGSFGYDYQVSEFVSKFVTGSRYQFKNHTWVFYNWVGANDFPLIASCTNVTACTITYIATHLANLQVLYNAGMRNLVLLIVDGGYQYNPEALKADPTGATATGLNLLAGFTYGLTGQFETQFLAQLYSAMPDLQVYQLLASNIVGGIAGDLTANGIRSTLALDPDPRNPYLNVTSAFPFPTRIDYETAHGADLTKTFYYDDNHPTEAGYKALAVPFIDALMSEYKVCNTATLGVVN